MCIRCLLDGAPGGSRPATAPSDLNEPKTITENEDGTVSLRLTVNELKNLTILLMLARAAT